VFAAPAALLLDATGVLLAGLVTFVIVAGGGIYDWFGQHVRIETVGNPLLGLELITLLRLLGLRHVPFCCLNRFPLDDATSRCVTWCGQLSRMFAEGSRRQALRVLLLVITVITLVKLANAALYPGFFSGDDVEIHEMTFARIFGWNWRAWELRSPFYPMTFIYPVQALLARSGVTETSALVFAGRAVVAILSSLTLWLTYRVGERLDGPGVGLAAAVALGMHRLHVTFGGSELPRPVASVFIVGAFLCLCTRKRDFITSALGGALLGIGACLRFGELAFILPAGLTTTRMSGIRHATVLIAWFVLTAAVLLGLTDAWYWGSPFYSLRKIVEYTLIDRLSSNGYQAPWFYIVALTSWSSIPVLALALYGAPRHQWSLALWWLLPIFVLSFMPHKEPRYMIPILPFVCLSAAHGLRDVLRDLGSEALWKPRIRRETAALVTVVFCVGAVLSEVGGWRFRKPSEPLKIARYISAMGCRGDVAVEQLWRVGGRLYLQPCGKLIDLGLANANRPNVLEPVLSSASVEWLVLKQPVSDDLQRDVQAAGLRPLDDWSRSPYFVARRWGPTRAESRENPGSDQR
jgi:hypothetical protein